METELLNMKERLAALQKGKSFGLEETESAQTVYSAIRDNPVLFKGKLFSVRTHKKTLQKRVLRTK